MSAPDGTYDVALKPKLLRSLLREYVPDEKHPFDNPSELSYVVSAVKTHKLLSEWPPHPAVEQDSDGAWKSAVDSWVRRATALASSNLPDKCWAGICLLGLTCQECCSERFLTSYGVWLNKLLSHIQPPVASHFVKAAACASLSDMFTRLSGFSLAKKDGTSQAMKVIQPALTLLNEDSSAIVLEEATCLLCTMINFFSLSVNRHYDNVEAAIVSKIISGKCSVSVLKKLGYCLSFLPKSRGDEESWSLMMDKILLYVNSQLNDAFQGLEEESRGTQTMRALLSSGKETPPPLSGLAGISELSTKRPERLLGSRISTLMQCCCDMLTTSYPVMVPVPVSGLIALAGRVLMVDGSLSLSLYSFMSTLKQEFICSEVPLMQLHSLELLTAVVKGLSSQLLPHVAGLVQLLTEYLRRCKFPDLKIKAYSIVKLLLMSMGIGIAIHISQDIISNIFIDLDFRGGDGKSSDRLTNVPTDLMNESRQKKRKHSSIARSSQEPSAGNGLEGEMPQNSTPLSVKIAALEVVEVLITSGGSMRSDSWRGNANHLLITVATNACKGGWSREERNVFLSDDPAPVWADFQMAALRALLASLLSPCRKRPSHLVLGLELFCKGTLEVGTKLAEYCRHALLALEVLIHPRSLPLLDLHSSPDDFSILRYKSRDTLYPNGNRQISTYGPGPHGKGPAEPESEEDDLNENWLGNDDELEIEASEKPPHPTEIDPNEKRTAEIIDDYMAESSHFANTRGQNDDGNLGAQTGALESVELEQVSRGVELVVENDIMVKNDAVSAACEGMASVTEQRVPESKNGGLATTIVERISAMFGSDNELSTDAIPDIVDGDPDSD